MIIELIYRRDEEIKSNIWLTRDCSKEEIIKTVSFLIACNLYFLIAKEN